MTLEDIVEELVGEIRDEYDAEDPAQVQPRAGMVDASISIEDFADLTGITLEDGSYETVAGYIIDQLGRIPDVGDFVNVDSSVIEVKALDGHRIAEVEVQSIAQGERQLPSTIPER